MPSPCHVQRTGWMPARRLVNEHEARKAVQELLHGDAQLEPGEVHAQAAMRAGAECQVRVPLTEAERVGVLEYVRVAVRGAVQQDHALTGRQGTAVERGRC